MTVGYMREASTAGVFTFLRLLFYWKGSVWKIVGYEYSFWLWAYMTISVCYRFLFKGTPFGTQFELFVIYCDSYVSAARSSLTFVLGFYVSIVASRWWNIFMRLPWPDTICMYIAALLRTRGDKYKREELIQRRTIVRYLVLSYVMVFRNISERIRKRFPDLDYLHGSLLTSQELDLIKKVEKNDKTCVYWLPLMWILKIFKRCYEEYRTLDEVHFVTLNQELRNYRDCLNDLLSYDWICTPLVYTQVVNLATAFYMTILMISSQYLGLTAAECDKFGLKDSSQKIKYQADYVLPLFASLQFLFYLGWLKVAQVTLNPFGTDDDDFEVDYLIERNLKMGYAMVDEVHDSAPELVEVKLTNNLPHTKASAKNVRKYNPMIGSVANLPVNRREAQIVPPQELVCEKKTSLFNLSNFMPRMEVAEMDGKGLLERLPLTAPNSSNMKTHPLQSVQKPKNSEVLVEQVTQTPSQHQETAAQVDARLMAAAAILSKEQQKTDVNPPTSTKVKSKEDENKQPLKEVTAQFSAELKPVPGTPKKIATAPQTPRKKSSERSKDHKDKEIKSADRILSKPPHKVAQSPKMKKEETVDKPVMSMKTKETPVTGPTNPTAPIEAVKKEEVKESKKDKEKEIKDKKEKEEKETPKQKETADGPTRAKSATTERTQETKPITLSRPNSRKE